KGLVALLALFASVSFVAPVASAAALPLVDVVGPHPDGTGSGATCADAIAGAAHVGACEGAASCPLYYDTYSLGLKDCIYTPPVNLGFLPSFEVVGPHPDGAGTGNSCSDVLADGFHVGACAGTYPACPIYYDTYGLGVKGCL